MLTSVSVTVGLIRYFMRQSYEEKDILQNLLKMQQSLADL